MKEKDALEQFIEAKLAEKQFSYQASYWDQAAGQMAACSQSDESVCGCRIARWDKRGRRFQATSLSPIARSRVP